MHASKVFGVNIINHINVNLHDSFLHPHMYAYILYVQNCIKFGFTRSRIVFDICNKQHKHPRKRYCLRPKLVNL